jgi:FtsH-binding integral membrane protein
VALVAFVVLLLVGMFWVNRILYLVIAGFACLLFSAYLLYDIQVGFCLLFSAYLL